MSDFGKNLVIGSGAWGSALAKIFDAEILPGRTAAKDIDADLVFIAVKAQNLREVLQKHNYGSSRLMICCKGIEQSTQKLMSEVVEEVLPQNEYAILSGPNFANEIMNGLPAAASLACTDDSFAKKFIQNYAADNFRIYYSDDLVTTQISGAVKNVLAIACGICEGLKLGDNARAALLTRGMAEISRLVEAKGGNAANLLGLSGFGDLVLTCTSKKSRNYKFGIKLASSKNIHDIISEIGTVEGYYTSEAVCKLAKSLNVEMPICNAVYAILYKEEEIEYVIEKLLQREQGKAG